MGAESDSADLKAKVALLAAENARLEAKLEADNSRGRFRGRSLLAVALIVLGSVLGPVAIATSWSRVVLSDTDAFVATYAPLAKDRQVREFLTSEISGAIEERLDVEDLVGQVFDGLKQLLPGSRGQLALDVLSQPAVDGFKSMIREAVSRVVESDAFAQVWTESLRTSHREATSLLSGNEQGALVIASEGLVLRLGPLVERVKEALAQQGFALASRIPAIERSIVIAPSDSLVKAQLVYRGAVMAGYWLALVAFALIVGGVLASLNRARATLWAAVGLGLGAVVILAGVAVGRIVAQVSVPPAVMPNQLVQLFFDTVTGALNELALATLALAVIVAMTAWLAGSSRIARKLRTGYTDLVGGLRRAAEEQGWSTGGIGEWLGAQRVTLRVGVAVVAGLVVFVNRPITVGLILLTTLVSVLVLLVLNLLERRVPAIPD